MWGLWGVHCCVFACPGRRETLEAFDKISELAILKVCQGFYIDARGDHHCL